MEERFLALGGRHPKALWGPNGSLGFEHVVESIRFHPPAKSLEYAVPFTKLVRQFTPLCPRVYDPKGRLHE